MPITIAEQRKMVEFGKDLVQVRLEAGYTQERAAEVTGISPDRISRLERGKSWPRDAELDLFFTVYGLNPVSRGILRRSMERGMRAGTPEWYEDKKYAKYMTRSLTALCSIEAEVCKISAVAPTVPGLLQIEQYIAALFEYSKLDIGEHASRIHTEIRLRRAEEAFGRPTPVELNAIFTEGALRQQVGGSDTMRRQLEHLLDMAGRPYVDIRVLSDETAGAAAATCGSFSIYDFEDRKPPVTSSDRSGSIDIVETLAEVQALSRKFEYLRKAALPPEASLDLINTIRKGFRK